MSRSQVFVVGSLRTNGPAPQVFHTLPAAAPVVGLDEGVALALAHAAEHLGAGKTPAHRVYRSEDGRTALVEVLDPKAEMTCLGIYKIAGMSYQAGPQQAAPPSAAPHEGQLRVLEDILHELRQGRGLLGTAGEHAAAGRPIQVLEEILQELQKNSGLLKTLRSTPR